jgi:hypothetical protein
LTERSNPGSDAPAAPQRKLKDSTAAKLDDAVPGTVPRMEMVAAPGTDPLALDGFAELAGFEGGLSEPERRLLTQTSHPGKRVASERGTAGAGEHHSDGKGEFKGFHHDSKGAIAC